MMESGLEGSHLPILNCAQRLPQPSLPRNILGFALYRVQEPISRVDGRKASSVLHRESIYIATYVMVRNVELKLRSIASPLLMQRHKNTVRSNQQNSGHCLPRARVAGDDVIAKRQPFGSR